MKISETINRADLLVKNDISDSIKIGWLSDLDGRISNEIIKNYSGTPTDTDYHYPEDIGTNLIISHPYDNLYITYLAAQIYLYLGEFDRYEKFNAVFSEQFEDYKNIYNIKTPDETYALGGAVSVMQIIKAADRRMKNNFTNNDKTAMLSDLDSKIKNDILSQYNDFNPALTTNYIYSANSMLIASSDFAEMYIIYLLMQISAAKNTMNDYANYNVLFEKEYKKYINYINRTKIHKNKKPIQV